MAGNSKFKDIITAKDLIIKNAEYFKITYTPLQIIERKETFDLYRELATFTKYRKPNNVILKGFPGSGKTVTVNFINKELKEILGDIESLTVNCNSKSTLEILKILTSQRTGTVQSLIEQFLKSLQKDTLIILDEVDRSNKMEDLLYYLSRPTEIYNKFNKNISLILISNNLHWEDNLKDSIRSSLQLKPLIFNPYSENQLQNIIRQRIKNGFFNQNAINNEAINLIAQRVSKERRGDCRVAIESVFYSAQIAESNGRKEINLEDVKKALKIAINASDKIIISKLKDNQLLVLYTLGFDDFNGLEEIHKNFKEIIIKEKFNVEIIGQVMIFHIINYLDDLCLIEKKVNVELENDIPRKRTQIRLNADKGLILDELNIRGLRLSKNDS